VRHIQHRKEQRLFPYFSDAVEYIPQVLHLSFFNFALNLLYWKHSGFSVDNSVKIPATSKAARVNLSQYIARHPVSLKKISYVKENGTVIYRAKYNEYWFENIKVFKAVDFIARLYRRAHSAQSPEKQTSDTLQWPVFQQYKNVVMR
jgi:hypothetical protein